MIPPLLINYSRQILLFHYTHLGFRKRHLHEAFRRALLGTYQNICIIHPTIILSKLKTATAFLFSVSILNCRGYIVSSNLIEDFRNYLKIGRHATLLHYWPSGLLTNSYNVYQTMKLEERNNMKVKLFYPQFLILFDIETSKLRSIITEANRVLIPAVSFCDSNENLNIFSHWIPFNLKSGYSKLFLLNYINTVFRGVERVRYSRFYIWALQKARRKFERQMCRNKIRQFRLVPPITHRKLKRKVRRIRKIQQRKKKRRDWWIAHQRKWGFRKKKLSSRFYLWF